MTSTLERRAARPMLVADPGAGERVLGDQQPLGLERGSPAGARCRPCAASTRSSGALGELAVAPRRARRCRFHSGQRAGLRPAGPDRARRRRWTRSLWLVSNTGGQVGSGEPAKAKNQISIAIEATIAVPTKTASTGRQLLGPRAGRARRACCGSTGSGSGRVARAACPRAWIAPAMIRIDHVADQDADDQDRGGRALDVLGAARALDQRADPDPEQRHAGADRRPRRRSRSTNRAGLPRTRA